MTRKAKDRPPKLDAPVQSLKPRALAAEEFGLWAAVAGAARPLVRTRAAPHLPKPQIKVTATPALPRLVSAVPRGGLDPAKATLDRTWDRKTALGEVLPDMVVDLHGHSLAQAHQLLIRGLHKAVTRRARLLLVITGKGARPDPRPLPPDSYRGVLRDALPQWLASDDLRGHIAATRPAHVRHGGEGATYVILRRARDPIL
jgi:DNA-nicking Smr family endonuclease